MSQKKSDKYRIILHTVKRRVITVMSRLNRVKRKRVGIGNRKRFSEKQVG